MSRYISFFLFLIISILLVGCDGGPIYDVNYPKPVVVEPDEDTRYTINGYKDNSPTSSIDSETEENDVKLIGNKNTKKLHKADCSYAKNLKEENIAIFDLENEAVVGGYVKCTRCFK